MLEWEEVVQHILDEFHAQDEWWRWCLEEWGVECKHMQDQVQV
jgi:hypothetical protein